MTFRDSDLDRHFDRRLKAAKVGLHLPSEDELMRGMAFFGDKLEDDIREYASRLSRRMKKRGRVELLPLANSLDELATEQSEDGIKSVEAALNTAEAVKGIPAAACRLRCQFYLASFGDPQAAAAVAGETASMAMRDVNESRGPQMLWRALAWSMLSRTLFSSHYVDIYHVPRHSLFRMLLNYEAEFESAILNARPEDERTNKEASAKKTLRDDDIEDPFEDEAETERAPKASVVVIPSIGNESTSEGKRVCVEFGKFVQRGLPLPTATDLSIPRAQLLAEFPYAALLIENILRSLVGRKHVHLRPTILVGPPGCGKTRFARRLVEELTLPYELISCGGLSDNAIGGTPRRWSSGEPSLPIMAVRRHECAGPAIILDEVEKIGTGRQNGNVNDVLIGLFEQETSSRWSDPYVEANCDLSHVTWLMTANEVQGIPAVLKDRCRILQFPVPGVDQLMFLAPRILERFYTNAGYDQRWATPLEKFEIEALSENWGGGSIRRLERLIEMLVEAREHHRPRQ